MAKLFHDNPLMWMTFKICVRKSTILRYKKKKEKAYVLISKCKALKFTKMINPVLAFLFRCDRVESNPPENASLLSFANPP